MWMSLFANTRANRVGIGGTWICEICLVEETFGWFSRFCVGRFFFKVMSRSEVFFWSSEKILRLETTGQISTNPVIIEDLFNDHNKCGL